MNTQQTHLAGALLVCLSGLFGQAWAGNAQTLPLPMDAPAVQPADDVQAVPEPADAAAVQAPEEAQAPLEPADAAVVQAPEEGQVSPEPPQASAVVPEPEDNNGSINVKAFPGKRYSLSPLPVDIYVMKGQKPTIAFTTPCIEIEKLTHGFPPIMAFENFMFTWIGNVNDSDLLPVRLEPVCI
jgi:hypothetical protein